MSGSGSSDVPFLSASLGIAMELLVGEVEGRVLLTGFGRGLEPLIICETWEVVVEEG
jgi:hypothetical protein